MLLDLDAISESAFQVLPGVNFHYQFGHEFPFCYTYFNEICPPAKTPEEAQVNARVVIREIWGKRNRDAIEENQRLQKEREQKAENERLVKEVYPDAFLFRIGYETDYGDTYEYCIRDWQHGVDLSGYYDFVNQAYSEVAEDIRNAERDKDVNMSSICLKYKTARCECMNYGRIGRKYQIHSGTEKVEWLSGEFPTESLAWQGAVSRIEEIGDAE